MSDPTQQLFLKAYEDYNDAIFRFCVIKTRNRDLALDITQEAFIKTWEYLTAGKSIENMRAFVYQVARNLIIDHSRKKQSVSLEAILEAGHEFGFEEKEQIENKIDGKQALLVLSSLKKKDHDVLLFRFVEDLSIPEIAEITGEKENTISVRIHRALKKAETLIEELTVKKND